MYMSTENQDAVEKHYMYLTYHLRPAVTRMIKYLHEEQILEPEEAEKIMSQAAHTMKVQHLLDKMMGAPRQFTDSLYASTLFTKTWPAADVLEPKRRPHKALDDVPLMPLPDEWPSQDHADILSSGDLKIKPVEPKDKTMKDYFQNSKKFNVYDMDKKTKGRALIINNQTFTHEKLLKHRSGSEHDRDGLKLVLENIGFEVKVENNQTAEQMEKLLQDECKVDHTFYNCFILVILSHGDEGIVYGADGKPDKDNPMFYVTIDSIQDRFTRVKSLAKKPKLFIIQACRGSGQAEEVAGQVGKAEHSDEEEMPPEPDHGGSDPDVEEDGASDSDEEEAGAASGSKKKHEPDQEADGPSGTGGLEETGDDEMDSSDEDEAEIRPPRQNDDLRYFYDSELDHAEGPLHFLIALPTTEGNKSWRDKFRGSWFIQAFIFVVANYAYKEDLMTLMLKVNMLVRRAKGEKVDIQKPKAKKTKQKSKKKKSPYKQEEILSQTIQVPEVKTTLIKKLYFFPGMSY